MSDPVKIELDAELPPIALRPEQPADAAFLLELYASTREEELELTNWDGATRAAFVKMQFQAMRQGYAGMFPDGQFSVVLLGDRAIGRMVIHRAQDEIHLVDMVLAPAVRCQGFGARLVRTLQAEARAARQPVSLQVLKGNRARRHYERLGFHCTGDNGPYDKMTWQPPA